MNIRNTLIIDFHGFWIGKHSWDLLPFLNYSRNISQKSTGHTFTFGWIKRQQTLSFCLMRPKYRTHENFRHSTEAKGETK